ncbi:MAG: nucleoside recognition domain-containing protein [Rhodospirillaceae bacterium]
MPVVLFLHRLLRDSASLYWELVKIMVPVMVAVKVAVDLGVIEVLTRAFGPLMSLVGLPQEMGLVWATAALVNIYGGAAALIGVLPETPLTVAQMTILGSLILGAHSMPVEQRVCQKAGAGLVFTTLLRLSAALVYGAILNAVYSGLDVLQQPVSIAWLPSTPADAGWGEWTVNSMITLATVFGIIVVLLAILRLFDATGITAWLTRILAPVLRAMGIGPQATPLAMVGVLLGLSYGGGLIIREARAGTLPPRDVFLAVCFMAICHSMIEDTLFIMALGGHWSGILVGRLVFSLIVMAVLARIVHALPDRVFERWLYRSPAPQAAE